MSQRRIVVKEKRILSPEKKNLVKCLIGLDLFNGFGGGAILHSFLSKNPS